MAADTCWMVVDHKEMSLGIGFTKMQARFNARDYLMEASSTEMTPNQAMVEIKKRLHHKSLFFRKYRLTEIDSYGEDGPSDGLPHREKIRKAWEEHKTRQPEIDALKANNAGLINKNAALRHEIKRMREYIEWVKTNAGIHPA